MIYEVTTNSTDYKIYPDNLIAEIAQNILMIILTPKYSVPLDRGLGVSTNFLDTPLNGVEQSVLVAEITQQVAIYEPRAKVVEVIFQPDALTAKLQAVVRFVLA